VSHRRALRGRGAVAEVPGDRGAFRQILGLERKLKVAILGAGNLGLALADYPGFRREGFQILALFDTLSAKVGQQSRGGVPIFDIKELRRIAARETTTVFAIRGSIGRSWLKVKGRMFANINVEYAFRVVDAAMPVHGWPAGPVAGSGVR